MLHFLLDNILWGSYYFDLLYCFLDLEFRFNSFFLIVIGIGLLIYRLKSAIDPNLIFLIKTEVTERCHGQY